MRAQAFFYLLPAMYAVFTLIFIFAWRAERIETARLAAIGFALSVIAIPIDMLRAPPLSYGFLIAIPLHWLALLFISEAFLVRIGARVDRRLAGLTFAIGGLAVAAATALDAREERIILVALTAAALLAPVWWRLRSEKAALIDRLVAIGFAVSVLSYVGRAATLKLSSLGDEVSRAPVFSGYWNFFYLMVALLGLLQGLLLTISMTYDLAQRSRDRSHRDALTGVANRRALDDMADRQGRLGAVVMVDLDHFKAINDAHGHAAGDEVLRRVARTIEQTTCDGTVVRMGGEEFAVLVPRGGDGVDLAHRLREAVAALDIDHLGKAIPVTASIGVARPVHGPGGGIEQLLREADEALYAAKRGGRNRVVLFDGVAA